ncbi:kelch-like protein 20 isoform X1 [Notamacropus eugenii]
MTREGGTVPLLTPRPAGFSAHAFGAELNHFNSSQTNLIQPINRIPRNRTWPSRALSQADPGTGTSPGAISIYNYLPRWPPSPHREGRGGSLARTGSAAPQGQLPGGSGRLRPSWVSLTLSTAPGPQQACPTMSAPCRKPPARSLRGQPRRAFPFPGSCRGPGPLLGSAGFLPTRSGRWTTSGRWTETSRKWLRGARILLWRRRLRSGGAAGLSFKIWREGFSSWCMDGKPMRRCTSTRPGETGMDVTSRCTLGDPNKLPEGVPQPARMPYISDKHPRQTLEVINLLRKHRELCDVVLVVGAKKIYAHRVILSACSPYFRAMFTGELAESRQTEVVIRDIDERAMELLIDFAYTSQITVEEGNVQTLLPAACLLQLAEIQEACCEFLKRQLDPSNCLGIRAFADTHSCRELLRIADKFTQHNFQEVMESEEFMLLPANQLIDIISSDELNVRSEEQVFNAVMAWVKYSIQERRPLLPQVLQHVRLPLLSPKFLVGTVGSDPLIKSDEECRDLVDEAKNYLLLPQERPLMQGPRTRPRKPIRCGEVLFAVGGWCSGDAISSVERYDPQTNEWRMVASMSKRRCGVGVSVLDDLLYAVGGHDGSSYLNSVERYDPKTNQWSSDVAPTSTCRTSVGVAVLGGYLYAVGGQDGVSCLNIVERYDPKENKWTRVASMSTRRLGVAVAVLGGFLYAVGGSDGTSPLNTVERYNPQENRWHTIAPMGTRRKHLGCAVYQDMIYAVGGRDDTTELSSAERYNPRTNQWSPVVAMTSRRSGVGLAVVNGQLMAVGGFDGTTYLKTIEVFDPDANTWRLYGGMNYRRLGGGVGVIKMTHCESHIW